MPHPTKKQRLDDGDNQRNDAVMAVNDFLASFDDLSDVLPNIFGFLGLKDIWQKRRVNKRWKEAVKKTVPPTDFRVYRLERYNAMGVMTRAMPNLQQLTIGVLRRSHKWSDGEDPDEELAARTADFTAHDIEIISNFSKMRRLGIENAALNGRYPFLFNSFPLLQKLRLTLCYNIKWDLEMLAGMPLLKELDCWENRCLTGNINSLRVLKDTLENVAIFGCSNVEGNFMDLADFPHLKTLNLFRTAVIGDIRDICASDFSALERLGLRLPKDVYGGDGYELHRISDASDLIRAVYLFDKQRPELEYSYYWDGRLSYDSPDWYESLDEDEGDSPPFKILFVKAGPRIGYRWEGYGGDNPCEVNWLDPEPVVESGDYAKYIEELQEINSQVYFYRGFHEPPTEEEYNRKWGEYYDIG
jgi:hypothetical protein